MVVVRGDEELRTTNLEEFKFGALIKNQDIPYRYPNVWAVEETTGPERLVIAPKEGHIDLLIALTQPLPEPFAILYVSLVPRSDDEDGRFQSPLLQRPAMETFLRAFCDLFERDGRHHVWVVSLREDYTPSVTLVYDQHNVIYAYGPLGDFQRLLQNRGLTQVKEVRFPDPHSHHFNASLDAEVTRLFDYWIWQRTPLHQDDEG